MATTKSKIRTWLQRYPNVDHSHMIVVCDTYDHSDYPIYILSSEDVNEELKEYDGENMQTIMEVYNLKMDIDAQLNEIRAYNL